MPPTVGNFDPLIDLLLRYLSPYGGARARAVGVGGARLGLCGDVALRRGARTVWRKDENKRPKPLLKCVAVAASGPLRGSPEPPSREGTHFNST